MKSNHRSMPSGRLAGFKRPWTIAVLLGVITGAVYYPSLKIPFLLDDYQIYLNLWPSASWSQMVYDVPHHFQQNRLLTHISWYAQMVLAGANPPPPFAFHVFNLILHGLNVWLVYRLAQVFGASAACATLTAAIFGVHPANQEAVSYVYGRSDLQVTALMLGALILFKHAPRRMAWALLCVAAAVMTKETVVVLPALYLLVTWVLRSDDYRMHPAALGLSILAAAGALAGFVFLKTDHADNFGYGFSDAGRYLMLQPFLLFLGLIRLIVPIGFTITYQFELPVGLVDARVAGAVLFWAAAIGVSLCQWRRGRRIWMFALGWYFACMSPTNSFVPRIDQISDRHMYLSLIAPMVALATAMEWAWKRYAGWIQELSWGVVVLFGALTMFQNVQWQSGIYIWKEAANRFPEWPVAQRELAAEYGRAGHAEREREILESVVRRWPTDWTSSNNLGIVYATDGRHVDAKAAFQGAILSAPVRHRAMLTHNLAFSLQSAGDIEGAIAHYRKALSLDPQALTSKQNLAVLLWQRGERAESEKLLREILAVQPQNEAARRILHE